MAGITLLEKNSVQVNYIINQFFRPELHQKFFDDSWGLTELSLHFYDPRTVIYGIMEQGKPTPIGIVYFLGVVPYRDCTVSAVIFDEANRNQDKVTGLIEKVKTDFTKRFSPIAFLAISSEKTRFLSTSWRSSDSPRSASGPGGSTPAVTIKTFPCIISFWKIRHRLEVENGASQDPNITLAPLMSNLQKQGLDSMLRAALAQMQGTTLGSAYPGATSSDTIRRYGV